jgi:hypothetical protein
MPARVTAARDRRSVRITLWIVAVVLMLSAAVYQRLTGPTHPLRGEVSIAGSEHRYRLVRSGESKEDARVAIPRPGEVAGASVCYKRYKTDDEFTSVPMEPEGDELVALLPSQPAAGKLEYFLEIETAGEKIRIPDAAEENVIIRFKDPVPIYFLLPHIVMMFLSVLIGMRAGLAALFDLRDMRVLAWTALVGMSIGGMTLGPVVQKFAFGAAWTGFPWGYDLTDNKMLILWVVWLAACAVIWLEHGERTRRGRVAVLVAALVMTVVYLIPHSLRGSELDYSKVDQGVDPSQAIETGD